MLYDAVCLSEISASFDWTPGWAAEALRTWQRLLPELTLRRIRSGLPIFEQGARAETLYLLRLGIVKVVVLLADGTESIVELRFPGEFVGWPDTIDHLPYYWATAVPLVDADLLEIRLSVFEAKLENHDLRSWVFSNLMKDLRSQCYRIVEAKVVPPLYRLEHLQRQLTAVSLPKSSPRRVRSPPLLADEELAEILGVSDRHLRRLRRLMGSYEGPCRKKPR